MIARGRRALVLAAGLSPGCPHRAAPPNPCAGERPGVLELRTREGAPELLLRKSGSALIICDGQERALGTLSYVDSPPGLRLKNAAGDVEAQIAQPHGEDAVLSHRQASVRLHDQGGLLRLLDNNGVPIGQVGRAEGKAFAYDPGGRPTASAEPVRNEQNRRAIRDPDGAVRHLVMGSRDDRASAVWAIEALPLVDRLLIARWLER